MVIKFWILSKSALVFVPFLGLLSDKNSFFTNFANYSSQIKLFPTVLTGVNYHHTPHNDTDCRSFVCFAHTCSFKKYIINSAYSEHISFAPKYVDEVYFYNVHPQTTMTSPLCIFMTICRLVEIFTFASSSRIYMLLLPCIC